MEFTVKLLGNKAVAADFGSHRILTDQPVKAGGEDSAPSPFDLFLISIGTCAGFYIQSFCQARKIPTDGIVIRQSSEKDEATKLVKRIQIEVLLPADFPEKYREGVVLAANGCSVKKHLANPPVIEVAAVAS